MFSSYVLISFVEIGVDASVYFEEWSLYSSSVMFQNKRRLLVDSD